PPDQTRLVDMCTGRPAACTHAHRAQQPGEHCECCVPHEMTKDRQEAWQMSNAVIATLGFVVLFGLMALRVPIGVAMGIVGVGGFAAVNGLGPGLSLLMSSPLS